MPFSRFRIARTLFAAWVLSALLTALNVAVALGDTSQPPFPK